ncbi:MAG: hypothetical protein SOW59_00025 [Corynebacterium sp.]|nr:hypothetical protein [Corynebacterium sp.]
MNQTSVRHAVGESAGMDLTGMDRAERVAVLRSRMDTMGGYARQEQTICPSEKVIYLGSDLSAAFPYGGLMRQSAISVTDCPAVIVELMAQVTKSGNSVAVVGWPELLFGGLIEHGDVSRVIAIPEPGADPWSVVSVLVEGLDVVIYHGLPVDLSPTRARPIWARIRSGNAAVITVGARLPGTDTHLEAAVQNYHGIGEGSGRIRGFDVSLRCTSKGRRPHSVTITCGRKPEKPRLQVV